MESGPFGLLAEELNVKPGGSVVDTVHAIIQARGGLAAVELELLVRSLAAETRKLSPENEVARKALEYLERISPGIRPVVYAWGHLVDELNHYQAALEEIAAVDPGNEWSCQSGMARKALNRQ